MSHTYAHNLMHCVFSTKERLPLIREPESLWRYTVGLAFAKGIYVISAGGTSNHAHLLILVPQTLPLAKVMQDIKANTSRWLRETSRSFRWQEGYAAFSVSHRNAKRWHATSLTRQSIIEGGVTRRSL